MCCCVFNCDNSTEQYPLKMFHYLTESAPNSSQCEANLETYINGQIYNKNMIIEEVDIIIKLIRRNWCYIQNVVINEEVLIENDLIQSRRIINKCLASIIKCIKNCDGESIKTRYITSTLKYVKIFKPLILPIYDWPESFYLKLTKLKNSKEKCPLYQYFHTFLEVQYYLLILEYICGNLNNFQANIKALMTELIILSEKCYTVKSKSVFICSCHKNLWLIVQLSCEKMLNEEDFWKIFNSCVANQKEDFTLWLLQQIASLQTIHVNDDTKQRIKPNYILIETSLKSILAKIEFQDTILSSLKSLEPLMCNLWLQMGKIEIYKILWDYFSKRLNVTSRNNTMLATNNLVELIDTILWTPQDCHEEFELFLAMLAAHLSEHPMQWGKMKGKIYSQLGPDKIRDLTNTGVFHVLLLFVVLTKVNFDELANKFQTLVANLPKTTKQSPLVWNFYSSLIIRYVRENRSIENITPTIVSLLEEASKEHKLLPLIKTFVIDFDLILKFSTNLQLHQWTLLNTWLPKYMLVCQYTDLISILKILLTTIDRISTEQVWFDWEITFKNYVYPSLKQVTNSTSVPEICGTLAAKIILLCPSLQDEAFNCFNSLTLQPKLSANFLCTFLKDEVSILPIQENLALQTWVKFCLLSSDNYDELTGVIYKLSVIPDFIKTEMKSSRDPLCTFIESIGANIDQHVQSMSMIKLCETCFSHVDNWIGQYLSDPNNEGLVLRIYTCMALTFYKIGPLLYNKYKNNCIYKRLITILLLSKHVMIEKPLNSLILQSIKKTWHLFYEATIKLNTFNDKFIEQTLCDLVVKFVPYYSIRDSPMLKCLDNEAIAMVILEKISNTFFKYPTQEAESNIFKSLKIVNEFVQNTRSTILLRLVVCKTLYGLLELVMFHSQRNAALAVITSIKASPLYTQIKSNFEEILETITDKYLASNSNHYFQVMETLGKFMGRDLKDFIPRIQQRIVQVERLQGVDFDKNLRLHLERLQASI